MDIVPWVKVLKIGVYIDRYVFDYFVISNVRLKVIQIPTQQRTEQGFKLLIGIALQS
ncbi:hypothetical protein D3C85_1536620 [compost metagenome]